MTKNMTRLYKLLKMLADLALKPLVTRLDVLESRVLEIDAKTRILDGWEDERKEVGCPGCRHWDTSNPIIGGRCVCKTNCCAGFRKKG